MAVEQSGRGCGPTLRWTPPVSNGAIRLTVNSDTKPMTCAEWMAGSSDYLDDLLGPSDRTAFDEHLAVCGNCARYRRIVSRGLDMVREAATIEPSPDFTVRLNRRLRGLDEERYQKQQSVVSGAAVTVALASVIALAAWSPILRPWAESRASAVAAAVTDAAEDGDEEWPNGSRLTPYVRPVVSPPPSMTAAFPGPYSPLVVEPPAVGRWSAGRAILAAYLTE